MAACSWRLMAVCGVAALGLGLGACQNKEQQAEMAALTETNTTLQNDRDAAIAAANAAEQRAREAEERAAAVEAARTAQAQNTNTGGGGWDTGSGANVRPIAQPTVLTMAGDVAFASGSADLTAAGKKELDGIVRTINSNYAGNTIKIEGYTDNTPLVKTKAKWGSNLGLSQARAESVMRYMSSKGIDSSRMEAIGMGEANPKSTKALSRRVEIHIMSH